MAGESLAQLRLARLDKLDALRAKGVNPYPSLATRTHLSGDVLSEFEVLDGLRVTVAGRLMSFRTHGALSFGHIQDPKGRLQLFFREAVLVDAPAGMLNYADLHLLDVGDFVQGEGTVTKTQRGEVSVLVDRLTLLSKSVRPLPDKWAGVQSPDLIRRKRYLQAIMQPEVLTGFRRTSEMIYAIRQFLNREGFVEFQTPILQPMYGGGTAKPFTTWLNAYDCRMYLAISHELYLKRLVIAGFENVFTIGRYFRNEGVDYSHNPEFSMLETMSAYQNYRFNMDLVERLFQHVAREVFGRTDFNWRGNAIDMSKPWRRVLMKDIVKEVSGIDYDSWTSTEDAANDLNARGVKEPIGSVGEGLALAYEELVSTKLLDPHLVYGHPIEISPLAKPMAEDPRFAERFEIVIGGVECGDNWSEQNDPIALKERWLAARNLASSLGHETHPFDTEFLEALEYGLPPTTGLGPGIERTAMLFNETANISDVMFFPTIKPVVDEDEEPSESGPRSAFVTEDQFFKLVKEGSLTVPPGVRVEANVTKWPTADSAYRLTASLTLSGLLSDALTIVGFESSASEGQSVEQWSAKLIHDMKSFLSQCSSP